MAEPERKARKGQAKTTDASHSGNRGRWLFYAAFEYGEHDELAACIAVARAVHELFGAVLADVKHDTVIDPDSLDSESCAWSAYDHTKLIL